MASAMKRRRDVSPECAAIVNAFLSDANELTEVEWVNICKRRAATKRQIRRADDVWVENFMDLIRPSWGAGSTPRYEQFITATKTRVQEIAARFPERKRWDDADHEFRAHIALALGQALKVLLDFPAYVKLAGGAESARTLTAAFEGFVRLPPILATGPVKARTRRASKAKGPSRASPRQPPYRMKPGDEVIESPLTLDAILAQEIGRSRQDRERFMEQLLEWANASAWLRSTPIEKLKDPVRMVRVLYWFRADAIVEGVWHFLSESWGARDHWEFLRRSCKTIRADGVLRCLDAVDSLFPNGIPRTEAAMEKAMTAFRDQDPDPLNEIDRKYQRIIDEEIPARLHAYLKAHRSTAEAARLP